MTSAQQARDRQSSAVTIPPRKTRTSQRGPVVLMSLLVLLVIVCVVSIGTGAVRIYPDQAVAILLDEAGIVTSVEFEARQQAVLTAIRLPRVVLGLLVGASLAAAGAAIQGIFRNPLADPGLIGISSGSAFATAVMIVLGNTVLAGVRDFFGPMVIPFASFSGGAITTLIIYRLSTVNGRTNIATMLLAGIAINALAGAGVGFLVSIADDEQIRDITFWNLGSLGRATWENVTVILPFIVISMLPMPFLARALNAMLLGETEAEHLGFNVERIKQVVVMLSAMAVGAGVAIAGIIGFIGLVVPHLLRLAVGPDHRYVLPGSALLGASLLVGADLFARTITAPAELPIGIVTALIGAPFFLWLLLRDHRRGTIL